VVVGERSFGKGSVQSIFRLRDGEGLRLTTARYFTPGGATIHERGITPDVELVMTPEEDRNVALQRARDDVTEAAAFEERFGFAPVADRQLEAALDVLRAAALVAGGVRTSLLPTEDTDGGESQEGPTKRTKMDTKVGGRVVAWREAELPMTKIEREDGFLTTNEH
jgi:carboxyl-terminal processing protease